MLNILNILNSAIYEQMKAPFSFDVAPFSWKFFGKTPKAMFNLWGNTVVT